VLKRKRPTTVIAPTMMMKTIMRTSR